MTNQENSKRIIVGVIIMMLGGLILMRSLGIYEDIINEFIFRWEAILIGIGLISAISHGGRGPGILMMIVGGVFIIKPYLDLPDINFWQILLATLFIIAGIFMIFRRKSHHECQTNRTSTTDSDTIDEVAVFGGGDRTVVSDNFRGGKILAIFGGSNFNLVRSKLAPGKNYIDLLIVFGGMKLVVPEDWNIKMEAISIFGGLTDKHRVSTPTSKTADEPELIIKGLVIFGGGEIKSY